MNRPVRLLFLLLLPLSSPAQTLLSHPDLAGYITRIVSPTDFDVAGTHVICGPQTTYGVQNDKRILSTRTPPPLALGQSIGIMGKLDRKHHTIAAQLVMTNPYQPVPASGAGIVDLVVPEPATPTDRILRADGYLLRVQPATVLTFAPPLASTTTLSTNLWINYHGVQQADGTILLTRAELRANQIKPAEDDLRTDSDYDPAAVDPNAKQGFLSKSLRGEDPKQIPPYDKNPAMQARIARIGTSVVPAFQRNLPNSDSTKIHFRFQLIDKARWRDAFALPSGVILVPYQIVERLTSDSQVAAVLADSIAITIEKQTLRAIPLSNKMTAANIAGTAGGIFVPGLGLATGLATGEVDAKLLTQERQQSGRVSLCLLHDAGYDLSQAPLAWWLLASTQPTVTPNVSLPSRAANLYLALGTTWRETLSSSNPSKASLTRAPPTP